MYALGMVRSRDNHGYGLKAIVPNYVLLDVSRGFTTRISAHSITSLNIQEAITGELPYHHIYRDYIVISAVMIRKELPPRPDVLQTGSKSGDKLWSLLLSCWTYEGDKRPKSKDILETVSARPQIYRSSYLSLIPDCLDR